MKKIINFSELEIISKKFQKIKKKIVLCHGVFDLLHYGHIKHFEQAKTKGDLLVVTVTPNRFVNKGPLRPIFNLQKRMESIAALNCVDYVCPNDFPDARTPINKLKPSIYCKGKDYLDNKEDITGMIKAEIKELKKNGGKVFYTNTEQHSSSNIINTLGLNQNKDQTIYLTKIKNYLIDKNKNIKNIFKEFNKLKVLVIGEVIIDEYIFCEALGKSGKEPVMVIRDINKERYLGGAGALVNNLTEFVSSVDFISYIGNKKSEIKFINNALGKKIKNFFLNKVNSPTIIKRRFIEAINKSKLLGVYTLNDTPLNTKQETEINKIIKDRIKKYDLVIVSDYGHGLISKKTAKLIVNNSKFVSVNTQINSSNQGLNLIPKYLNADLISINENELRNELREKDENLEILIKKFAKKFKIKYLNITCGNNGSFFYSKKTNKIFNCPAFASKVVDKVGAGDSMLPILSISIFKKVDSKMSVFFSSIAAAINIQSMANKTFLKKINFIKAIETYLK